MHRFRASALGLLATLASLSLFVAPASAATHDPVLFVHGWQGSSSNWNDMIADFDADGYSADELFAWDYNSDQPNEETAREFADVVENMLSRTGASAVDVVTHSMGGLNTRWYLKFLGGTDSVDDWVSLGGPNHGTSSAYFCHTASCSDMRPGSAFLSELNSGDETPGSTDYGTWWSPCDAIINPDESVVLSGADNTRTGCLSHSALLSDDTVSEQVRDFVA